MKIASFGKKPLSTPRRIRLGALLLAVAVPELASAATLRDDTVAAWNDYLRVQNAEFQERLSAGRNFLWTFDNADRAEKVHGGEIVVAPAPCQNPIKLPGGLIHHWIGAAFLPGVRLNDALEVTRDYSRYKEFYHPTVIDSKTIRRDESSDKFSMLLLNKVLLSRTALDADYESIGFRVGPQRAYRISSATRIQEIEDLGRPEERKFPEGEGAGYIWRLYSIARFEQRGDGVYVELEAMALSRDIPAAVRFIADPIVRRVSRSSLVTSLQQTEEAVRKVALARSVTTKGVPADIPPSFPVKSSEFVEKH